MKGLTRSELEELKQRYFDYYDNRATAIPSVRELARMYELEQRATDRQVARLLSKYGKTLESEFGG